MKPLLRTFNALYSVYNVYIFFPVVQRTESKDTQMGINSSYLHIIIANVIKISTGTKSGLFQA